MASITHSAEEIGDSDATKVASSERRSLDKREQTISTPEGSPRSQRSGFSAHSTTSSAASFDLAGRVMAFEAAHTVVGQNGEKSHGAGSPMHRRNRSASKKVSSLEVREKRDDSDHNSNKFNTTLNDTLSTITKAESEKMSNADKESVVSSASRISSLSQKILQVQNAEKVANNDKDSVVSAASRISSLSQKMLQQVSTADDKDSEDSIMLSANLIASLSQKILEKQNEKGSTDKDSVLSSAALITSLSQRILQSRKGAPNTPLSANSRPSFKSRSSRNSHSSFEKADELTRSVSSRDASRSSSGKVEEVTSGDKESVTSSVTQVSSVSQRIKALERNSSTFTPSISPKVSPRTSLNSATAGPTRSSLSKVSKTTGIDQNSMSRIQERIKAMQKADASSTSSQRPPRPSFTKRSASSRRSNPNPQEATRPISPPETAPLPQSPAPFPTETIMEGSSQNNISGVTMDEDVASTTTPQQQQQLELNLQNVSELSALPDDDPELPPTIHRFTLSGMEPPSSSEAAAWSPKATSHASLPNPIAHAMDAMRYYSTSPFFKTTTTGTNTGTSPSRTGKEGQQQQRPFDWFPREHFAVANALFPEHQFGVNNDKDFAMMESRSLPPPMRARSHSEGDDPNPNNNGLDDFGFPKFLESQREPNDKVPHHIQFNSSDDDRWSREGKERNDQDGRRHSRDDAERRNVDWLRDLGKEMLEYSWKDKLPIAMGCLLIFIGIIVGISMAATSGDTNELNAANFDLDVGPTAQLCDFVEKGYSIPGEDQYWEIDMNWLLDVSLVNRTKSKARLNSEVQQLFQQQVIPTLVGCRSTPDVLEGQYLIANGYAWSVRDIGNCEKGTPMPCSKLLVSFVLWTKAYRDVEAMNSFATSNFGRSTLMNPLEQGYNIRQVKLVSMVLKV